jgi:hypothetical protein
MFRLFDNIILSLELQTIFTLSTRNCDFYLWCVHIKMFNVYRDLILRHPVN